ncbi:unnamed protein product [Heterobilharzia americana]|nr:unnamed protein product [Heterobilharzia americana]
MNIFHFSTIAASLKPKNLQASIGNWSSDLNALLRISPSKTSIRSWPFFGSSCFLAFVESGLRGIPTDHQIIIALTQSGIHILGTSARESYLNVSYEDVASTRVTYKDDNEYSCPGAVRLTTSSGQQIIFHLEQTDMNQTFKRDNEKRERGKEQEEEINTAQIVVYIPNLYAVTNYECFCNTVTRMKFTPE